MRRLLLITLLIGGCDGFGSGLIGIATTGGAETGPTGGSAPILNFFAQPNTATVGETMSLVLVGAIDSLGSLDTTFTGAVTMTLAANSTGAGLGGTTTVRASKGFASFGNLTVNRAGTYTMVASASGATSAISAPFAITTITP
ncbi:MAG: hypothetical protein ACM358_11840 [Gemmatimonadota bacterium]